MSQNKNTPTPLPDRLRRARKGASLSLRKAALLTGVSHASIKKYEEGTFPSSDILLQLAKAYKVRVEYFFRPTVPDLKGVKFRKRDKLKASKLGEIEHIILDQVERRLEIEDLCPNRLVQPFKIPKDLPQQIDTLDQIEEIANKLRKKWDLGLSPIINFIDILEEHGIRVFSINVDDPNFDGLSGTVGKDIPIIVVDSSWPGDRQRFTLSHELGHLILEGRLSNSLNEESASNHFAGAFLLPKSIVSQELGKKRTSIEIRELLLIKEEYGISILAQCYRLKDLGIISENYFSKLYAYFKKQGWKETEPGKPFPVEKVHIFQHIVLYALSEDIIGESKSAELLNMTIEDFRTFRTGTNDNPPTY